MKRNILFFSILIIGIISLASLHSNSQQFVHADEQAVSSGNWESAVEVSTGAIRARRPAVAAAPGNKTVLVVYSATSSGGSGIFDINYSFSDNFGDISPDSWTKHEDVYSASTAESDYAHATFDQNDMAHVVWVENSDLAYANSSNLSSGFGNHKFFSNLSVNSEAFNPKVITYGENVHIVWAEGDFSGTPEEVGPNIYHAQYYKNDEDVWEWSDIAAVTFNDVQTEKPAIAVDLAGNLHVAYQQQIDASHYNILYAKGTFDGSTITWEEEANHVDITSNIPAGTYTMVEPSILNNNGRLEVSATRVNDAANPKEAPSYIYHITCNDSCDNANNWDAARISEPNGGTASALYVDITPSNIVSSIVRLGSCTAIVFDGKVTSTQDDKEQIFNSSSCNGWGDGREELTINDESRTIQPAATTQYGWWMYVVFEEFSIVGNAEEIYFMRNIPGVYLPMIAKPK